MIFSYNLIKLVNNKDYVINIGYCCFSPHLYEKLRCGYFSVLVFPARLLTVGPVYIRIQAETCRTEESPSLGNNTLLFTSAV